MVVPLNVLAISGSLRTASVNSAYCRAAARLAPPSLLVTVYTELGDIPPFNPDLDATPSPPVERVRTAVRRADALIIASPEYAPR